MKFTFTKYFCFSSSFSKGAQIFGHNYILGVTTDWLEEGDQRIFEKKINEALISKIHSHDLGLHVDYFKNVSIDDRAVLTVFSEIIRGEIAPLELRELTLERDQKTLVRVTL